MAGWGGTPWAVLPWFAAQLHSHSTRPVLPVITWRGLVLHTVLQAVLFYHKHDTDKRSELG